MALEKIRLVELRSVLSVFIRKTTTEKQRRIFLLIEPANGMSKTQTVKSIARRANCAESTVWDSVSLFNEIGLVSCENGKITMTSLGLVCKELVGDMNGSK